MKMYDVNIQDLGFFTGIEAKTPIDAIKAVLKTRNIKACVVPEASNNGKASSKLLMAAVKYRGNQSVPRKYKIWIH